MLADQESPDKPDLGPRRDGIAVRANDAGNATPTPHDLYKITDFQFHPDASFAK